MLRYLRRVQEASYLLPPEEEQLASNLNAPTKLHWTLSPSIREEQERYALYLVMTREELSAHRTFIERSLEGYEKVRQDIDFRLLHFHNYGANWIKDKAKLSPDSFVQMALQLAYYKLHNTGLPLPLCSSAFVLILVQSRARHCHLRDWSDEAVLPWAHGDCAHVHRRVRGVDKGHDHDRRDKQAKTHRVASQGSRAPFEEPNERRRERYACFSLHAQLNHILLMRTSGTQGHGIDRHLLGMRILAMEDDEEKTLGAPELFKDKTFAESTNFRLSTSNMPGKLYISGKGVSTELLRGHCSHLGFYPGFGPVVPDGYGVCYGTRNDMLQFTITSLRSCPNTGTTVP